MKRSDIVVRCAAGHEMQRFRWMGNQGVWVPVLWADWATFVSADGVVTKDQTVEHWETGGAALDHASWPLCCNECTPVQTRSVRDDRMELVLDLLHAYGRSDVSMALIDEFLSRMPRSLTRRRF